MNTRPDLDHDGLDGILPAAKKQPFIYKYLIPIVIFIVLAAIALILIWSKNNDHVSQPVDKTEVDIQAELSVEGSKEKNMNIQGIEDLKVSLESKEPVILENPPKQLTENLRNEKAVTVSEPEMLIESSDLKENEPEKVVLHKEVYSENKQSMSIDQPVLISADSSQKNTILATSIKDKPFTLLFGFASSKLKKLSNDQKQNLTDFVDRCNNHFSIVGHSCNQGPAASNQKLGLARAKAVYRYLVELGVNKNTLTTSSEGMDNPVASNATRAERRLNRRVEIHCKSD